jgi:lysophospholipase L1-like esterase
MAGTRLPHSFAGKALKTGANVIVISFGTNDASNAVDGGGGYSADAAKFHALNWIHRARAAGAGCVVWVLGNSEAYAGRTWKAQYKAYLNNLNGWIRSVGPTVSTPSGTIKLRTVDFGGIVRNSASYGKDNGVHPSAAGAVWLGALIKQQIQGCT